MIFYLAIMHHMLNLYIHLFFLLYIIKFPVLIYLILKQLILLLSIYHFCLIIKTNNLKLNLKFIIYLGFILPFSFNIKKSKKYK